MRYFVSINNLTDKDLEEFDKIYNKYREVRTWMSKVDIPVTDNAIATITGSRYGNPQVKIKCPKIDFENLKIIEKKEEFKNLYKEFMDDVSNFCKKGSVTDEQEIFYICEKNFNEEFKEEIRQGKFDD